MTCLPVSYLRATKWNVSEAETRLQSTLTWRREYDLKKLTPELLRVLVGGQEIQTWPSVVIIAQNDLLARFVLN
jgi:hypothetical protein